MCGFIFLYYLLADGCFPSNTKFVEEEQAGGSVVDRCVEVNLMHIKIDDPVVDRVLFIFIFQLSTGH